MLLDRIMFGLMYRIGFTPWDGHRLGPQLQAVIEGPAALPKGRALDVGCGTGDTSIYLAQHGWDVTAIDLVEPPLRRARVKTGAAGVRVRYLRGDVTKLSAMDVTPGMNLIVDNGCMHGMSDPAREAYAREMSRIAAPGARLQVYAFGLRPRRGPRGLDRAVVEQWFGRDWQLLGSGIAEGVANDPSDPIHYYDLARVAR